MSELWVRADRVVGKPLQSGATFSFITEHRQRWDATAGKRMFQSSRNNEVNVSSDHRWRKRAQPMPVFPSTSRPEIISKPPQPHLIKPELFKIRGVGH